MQKELALALTLIILGSGQALAVKEEAKKETKSSSKQVKKKKKTMKVIATKRDNSFWVKYFF